MDRRQIIESYFQQRHRENERFNKIFIEPTAEQLGLVSDYTELFSFISSVEFTPSKYLERIADKVGYKYEPSEDPEVQREIIKRVFSVYEKRGTPQSILDTVMKAMDTNWIGGDLTQYKDEVKELNAGISYPRDLIFTHDSSFHDGGYRFQDKKEYNNGIIAVELEDYNERTLSKLEEVIPGGVRVNLTIFKPVTGDGEFDSVQYPYEVLGKDSLEELTAEIVSNELNDTANVEPESAFKAGSNSIQPTDVLYKVAAVANLKVSDSVECSVGFDVIQI